MADVTVANKAAKQKKAIDMEVNLLKKDDEAGNDQQKRPKSAARKKREASKPKHVPGPLRLSEIKIEDVFRTPAKRNKQKYFKTQKEKTAKTIEKAE